MSRGRSHHQSSRRRNYSSRQRDLRERQPRDAESVQPISTERFGSFEIEEQADFESPAPWHLQLSGRASAA